jgi:hypothetical protein
MFEVADWLFAMIACTSINHYRRLISYIRCVGRFDCNTIIIAISMFTALRYCQVTKDHVAGHADWFDVIFDSSKTLRGVAQSGSALHWGCKGHRFKSCRPDHIDDQKRLASSGGSFCLQYQASIRGSWVGFLIDRNVNAAPMSSPAPTNKTIS